MSRLELRLKPIKDTPPRELETFVNTIYDNFFREIRNLEDCLKNENEPLHYLLLQTRLEATRDALRMYESVVDEATEFKEIEVDEE